MNARKPTRPAASPKRSRGIARGLTAAAAMLAAAALTGCLESSDVTMFTPGEYQGAADPLAGGGDEAALNERFAGQTDR